jgi:cation:H+ antiporter
VNLVVIILFFAGLALLIAGGESLVRGASRFATSLGIRPVVIGLTVVAFGTSAPELAVSVGSSLAGEPDLIVGNVIGSNIYNVLLVLGLAAIITPLIVREQLVRRDVPLMVLASLGTLILALDGGIGRTDGVILFGALIAWLAYSLWESRRTRSTDDGHDPSEVAALSTAGGRLRSLAYIVVGLVMLVIGARWLVDGAVAVATMLGLSSLVIGLTVVAIGTSLPEVATSVVASIRGERDIAVGNVVGSNLFNLLAVLGLTAIITGDIPVAPGALTFDLPVMVAVAIACLPVFFTGHLIARWEGALFLAYGAGYTAYLLATAIEHPTLPSLGEAIAAVVLPLTALTLLIFAARQWQERGMRVHRPD